MAAKSPIAILSLPAQLDHILRKDINTGVWRDWLPDERSLAAHYHVSRSSMRLVLRQLEKKGIITTFRGLGRQITGRRSEIQTLSHSIGILSPEPLEQSFSSYWKWSGELRALLHEHDLTLEFHHGKSYFSKRAVHTLPVLVSRYSHLCWVLLLSSQITQKWFVNARIPCVVAGTSHPGMNLPSLDQDQRAKCRHACGVLLSHGHTKIAFLNEDVGTGGMLESVAGFWDAVNRSSRTNIQAEVHVLPSDGEGISRKVRNLFSGDRSPTALLVANAFHYAAVATTLMDMGLRIPEDVSIISRGDEPFLSYMHPQPARYIPINDNYAAKLGGLILHVIGKVPRQERHIEVAADFFKGASLANCRSAQSQDIGPLAPGRAMSARNRSNSKRSN